MVMDYLGFSLHRSLHHGDRILRKAWYNASCRRCIDEHRHNSLMDIYALLATQVDPYIGVTAKKFDCHLRGASQHKNMSNLHSEIFNLGLLTILLHKMGVGRQGRSWIDFDIDPDFDGISLADVTKAVRTKVDLSDQPTAAPGEVLDPLELVMRLLRQDL
ncbi:hypothetical protein BDV33DRAFT_165352 [Aspergillus novoparasiticus]|uniref:Uncharacterized protein n=1 Tax=Aspergillus novoparasiticus TaxID=986946 RepID=A0A5N6F6S6_9EURO|nr:hypothetical protein BDV33DRAFT_165352 [Aspergillus novoparasiticus]